MANLEEYTSMELNMGKYKVQTNGQITCLSTFHRIFVPVVVMRICAPGGIGFNGTRHMWASTVPAFQAGQDQFASLPGIPTFSGATLFLQL